MNKEGTKRMSDFNWQKLPEFTNLPEVVEWADVVKAPAYPEQYVNHSLAWKFGTNLMIALEAQYRIMMMPPISLELVKLQAQVARDMARQAIELGHTVDRQDKARADEIIAAIKQRMDELDKS